VDTLSILGRHAPDRREELLARFGGDRFWGEVLRRGERFAGHEEEASEGDGEKPEPAQVSLEPVTELLKTLVDMLEELEVQVSGRCNQAKRYEFITKLVPVLVHAGTAISIPAGVGDHDVLRIVIVVLNVCAAVFLIFKKQILAQMGFDEIWQLYNRRGQIEAMLQDIRFRQRALELGVDLTPDDQMLETWVDDAFRRYQELSLAGHQYELPG
jgi:hypothetical protein